MSDPILKYDDELEKIRLDTIKFLHENGIMQTWLSKKMSISNCSVSLFLNSKRILVPEKIEIIKKIIYK
jgi:hypothetical protein